MKLKHWAYLGIALIAVNAFLLGGIRAAELTQVPGGPHQPRFGFLRLRLSSLWRKPRKEMVTPVTVRLFAGEKLRTLWLKNEGGLLLSGLRLHGPIFVSLQDGKLRIYRGGHCQFTADKLAVSSLGDQAFEIRTRRGTYRWTRGEVKLYIVKDAIRVVNRLEVEDYVSGILEGELGTLNLSPEVLKAQIVVARSYVLAMRGNRHHGEGYEFCDSPHCQVFGGIPQEREPALDVALAEARGKYLSYRGRPIAAFYHHNCGGETSAVEDVWPTRPLPYLKAVREAPNSVCRLSRKSLWRVSLSKKSLTACFGRAGWLKRGDSLQTVQIIRKDGSGRAQRLLIQSSRRAVKVNVGRFRNVLNHYFGGEPLKSAHFTISVRGGAYMIRGRGWGHGVGFCQEGAKQLARQGQTYQQILAHYFPHTQLAKRR